MSDYLPLMRIQSEKARLSQSALEFIRPSFLTLVTDEPKNKYQLQLER